MEPKTKFLVTTPPHLKAEESTADIMRWVCIALAPAFGVAFYAFGWYCLLLTAVCVATCVVTEAICQKLRGVHVTVSDFSAVVTGLLLAAVLPPNVKWWVPVIGGVFAVVVVKQLFGGLGSNIWNPALAARAFLQVSMPTELNSPFWPMLRDKGQSVIQRLSFTLNGSFADYEKFVGGAWMKSDIPATTAAEAVKHAPDVISQATVLTALKNVTAGTPEAIAAVKGGAGVQQLLPDYSKMVWESFIGLEGGCIAEASAVALLLGGLFLLWKKIITWEAPVFYLATVAILGWILPAPVATADGTIYTAWLNGPMLLHLFGGGLMLAAFFMDTDYVTTPMTRKGKIIFAVGCGLITAMIRLYSSAYPEGCCYSILIMNTCVPLIDAWTRPKKFGLKKA